MSPDQLSGLELVQELAREALVELQDILPSMVGAHLVGFDRFLDRFMAKLQPLTARDPTLQAFTACVRNDIYSLRSLELGFFQIYILGALGMFDQSRQAAEATLDGLDRMKQGVHRLLAGQDRVQRAHAAKELDQEPDRKEGEPCP